MKSKIGRRALVMGAIGAIALMGFGGGANAADVTLKVHHFLPPVAPTHSRFLVPWTEKVTKASGGRIAFEIFPAMQLGGKPPQLIQQVKDGVADIVWTLPGYTPGRFTKTEVFELPFMHTTTTVTNKALWEFAQKHGDEWNDYKVLALHVHAGQLIHSAEAIRTVDDIKGLKIRTPTRTGGWMIEAMGATPVGAPVPKIPEMLSKRVVDAVLIPYEITIALKVDELVDFHISLDDPKTPRLNTSEFVLAMNKDSYAGMPADLQKILDDNSGANISEWLGEIWDAAENPGRGKAEATGELIKMAPAEVAKLKAMVEKPVADRWVAEMKEKGIDGQALIDEAKALIAKYSN